MKLLLDTLKCNIAFTKRMDASGSFTVCEYPLKFAGFIFKSCFSNTKTDAVLEDTTFVTHRLGGYPSAK